ncbi:MAG: hypothetical protein AAB492_01120 [Patescibacteria group bacterium]
MNWITASILSAVLYSTSNAVTKVFQPKLSFGIGMVLFSIGVLVSSLVLTMVTKTPLTITKVTQQAMTLAFVSGLIWAFAQLFLLMTLAKNAPLSIAIPVIVGGIAVGGILAGVAFFGETLSPMRIVGIMIVLIGTVILSR